MDTEIAVTRVTPLVKGNLKGFADVQINGITIKDWRVVQQPGQDAWVSPPCKTYEKDGKTKYVPLIEMSQELKTEVQKAILARF